MTASSDNPSQKRLQELEAAVLDKDRELNFYRQEIVRLNEKIEHLIGQFAHEVKLATLIQRAMVPTEIPTIPGFEFSTKFVPSLVSGGDYYDIFELEDRFRFGILACGSSGYGLSSLFLSIMLRTMGTLEARRGAGANVVVDLLAKELIPAVESPSESAALFYGVVDRRSFELSYCLLGDQPAYLLSLSSERLEKLLPTGPVFSKNYAGPAQAKTLSLNPRDRLVIGTEGILLAKNTAGQVFGMDRLERVIRDTKRMSPHEARNEIHYQIQKFIEQEPLARDVTVLVADVKDRVLKLARRE